MATISEALALALQHHHAGRLPAAEQIYRQILAVEPNQADALHLLGVIAHQVGKPEIAVEYISRAIALNGAEAAFHSTLGIAFQVQGKLDNAVACYRRATELKPDYAEAYTNLGSAFKEQGKLDDAVACHRRALLLKPDYAEAHYNLGNALRQQGKLDDAVNCYRRAGQLKPSYVDVYNNLGNVLQGQGKLDEAIDCYRRVMELRPNYAEAHYNLGTAFQAQGRLDEAVACFRRSLELKPACAEVYNNLGNALKDQGKPDEAVACFRKAVDLRPGFAEAHSNFLFTLNYCSAYDAETIHRENILWNRQHAEPLAKFIRPHANERSATRRLRIGYVSPDFRDHVVGLNLLPLFREHDHRHFEIVCYANTLERDQITDCFQSYADTWRNVARLTDDSLVQSIRDDGIDILVDLALHTSNNRLLAFARKPAPVQVAFVGYPGTTGMSAIDYRLTDVYLDPPGHNDRHYTEESIRLPDTFWCYDSPTNEPAINPLPALENGYVTFGCLNNFCKVNAAVLKHWAQVLRAVERSRILMLALEGSHRQDTLALLALEGIEPERVHFVAKQSRPKYLELYQGIDVGLDTFPYNGHTTSLDSLWMGVPVVTLVGQTIVGRAGLSQLSNLRLPGLIAMTTEQFVSIAVGLAGDLPRLSRLRATMRERMQASSLMDAPRFARNIEAAYRSMWQRWCAK